MHTVRAYPTATAEVSNRRGTVRQAGRDQPLIAELMALRMFKSTARSLASS